MAVDPFKEGPIDAQFKVKSTSNGSGKKKNEPIDAEFRVKDQSAPMPKRKSQFFAGIKSGAKKTGKGLVKVSKAGGRGFLAASKVSASAKTKLYEKQQLSLERRQNIATFRANIAQQKLNRLQAKTVAKEAKLKQLELKQARREFLKSQRASRVRKGPLSDKGFNLPRKKKPGFFD